MIDFEQRDALARGAIEAARHEAKCRRSADIGNAIAAGFRRIGGWWSLVAWAAVAAAVYAATVR